MLLQAVIVACLENPEYYYIGSLDLSIAIWMRNRCIANFDAEVFTVLLEHPVGDLRAVVSDDPIRDPNPIDD
jgi:hypothetical protein